MLIRFFSLLFVGVLLASCVHIHHPTMQPVLQNRIVPAFNQVIVKGRLNVSLHTGCRQPQVILHGDPRDIAQVSTLVANNTLVVTSNSGYPGYSELLVEICARSLRSFNYQGAGTITGNNLHINSLDLSITNPGKTQLAGYIGLHTLVGKGDGYIQINGVHSQFLQLSLTGETKVQLEGVINISNLDLDGDGKVGMYWIKSKSLTIHSRGTTFIQMAGVVDQLDLELWGTAQFKGRYLRANRTFVKTHDESVAEIKSLKHQHTLASDHSNIYFYQIPITRTDFMAFNGAVLDMRDWNQYEMRDYDRFNK